jgi:hypothetical protein
MTTLATEANRDDLEDGKLVMVVLDRTGDSRHIWDRNNADEVSEARALFTRMTQEKKFQAWSVTRKGDKDQRITEFDPAAEKIIFSPALVGG